MLSINNWRFNKNLKNHSGESTPLCKPENWTVEIKLSSSVFAGGNSTKPTIADDGRELYFDQNGLHMAYNSFVGLFSKPEFTKFMAKIAKIYEQQQDAETRNKRAASTTNDDDDDDEEDHLPEEEEDAATASREKEVTITNVTRVSSVNTKSPAKKAKHHE